MPRDDDGIAEIRRLLTGAPPMPDKPSLASTIALILAAVWLAGTVLYALSIIASGGTPL